jgi:hypothetical protein
MKLYIEKLHVSPNINKVIKSRRMRWARHGGYQNVCKTVTGKLEWKRPIWRQAYSHVGGYH